MTVSTRMLMALSVPLRSSLTARYWRGYFTSIGGQTRNRIARLNSDGTADTAFNLGANDYVYSLAVQSDAMVTYTPDTNYNGADSFTFKVNDGTVDSDTATVSITVTEANDTPAVTWRRILFQAQRL